MKKNGITEDALARVLEGELGYSPHAARATAADLLDFKSEPHEDLDLALAVWFEDRLATLHVLEAEFDAAELAAAGAMSYPGALVFIDWLRTDPASARDALVVE